jgi:dUTP pyrophosphatase
MELMENENFKMKIGFINKSNNENPKYETEGASGFDIRANLDKEVVLKSLDRVLIPTGLSFELPPNMELQIRPRSGLAYKNGITVLNSPGTIDSDYRGDVGIILINLGKEDFKVNHGDRIAQGVIAPSFGENLYELIVVDELTETERSNGGFGSTGKF